MNMNFQNVQDADGIGIAITGMSVVFSGLVLISLYITLMPRLFEYMEQRGKRVKQKKGKSRKALPEAVAERDELSEELLSAIAYVIHMEREYEEAEDHQRITIQRDESQQMWAVTGRLRNLSTRM